MKEKQCLMLYKGFIGLMCKVK